LKIPKGAIRNRNSKKNKTMQKKKKVWVPQIPLKSGMNSNPPQWLPLLVPLVELFVLLSSQFRG